MGLFGIFSDENHSSSNSTTSQNTSNTTTTNTSINTSTNTSDNRTNTLSQDRRLVNDGGYGVSADNSTVMTRDSGNSFTDSNDYTNSVASDNHSWYNDQSQYTSIVGSDFGAISAAKGIADNAIGQNGKLGELMMAAMSGLASSSQKMFDANMNYAMHIADQNKTMTQGALSEVKSASQNALAQVAAIAAKPLDAQNPQHILVIVGLVVFGVFAFNKFKA